MSFYQNEIWLEEKRDEFDKLMSNDPDLDDFRNAYQIILEVEAHGFKTSALHLEDEWGEIVKKVDPDYYKEFKSQND